ncbi:hypothetical protein Tsubulata_032913, partial [Turnera subulata]
MVTELQEDAVWGAAVEKLYIDILVDHVNKGDMIGGQFSTKVWQEILEELNVKSARNYTKKQVKQKYNRLRAKHRIFSNLLQTTGFGWDPVTNTVIAEDSVWRGYIQRVKDVAQFRRKGCDHYELLGVIFNRSTATGNLHHASAIEPPNSDEERRLDEEYVNTGVHVNLEDDNDDDGEDPVPIHTTERVTHSEKRTIIVPEQKPKKKDTRMTQFNEAIKAYVETSKIRQMESLARVERYKSQTTTSSNSSPAANFSMTKCIHKLEAIDDINEESFVKAIREFKNQDAREAFIVMSDKNKKLWLRSLV